MRRQRIPRRTDLLYETIGYPHLETSAETGEGIEALRERIKNKVTLLVGHSGVGKSSLINALQKDAARKVGKFRTIISKERTQPHFPK